MGYSYYDTPDGQDCLKKLGVITKNAATYGLFASALDVIFYSHPKGYAATAARFGFITLPFIGIATTFSSTTCILADVRKKDDHLNYMIGGAAAGAVIGVWQRSAHVGSLCALFCGIGGAILKEGVNEGWKFINMDIPPSFGDFWTIKYDLSFTKERPRTWVKE